MIDEEEVRLLLRNKLLNAGLTLPNSFAWQGVEFDIPAADEGASWMREQLSIIDETLAATSTFTVLGSLFYQVFTVAGNGTKPINQFTLDIANEFSPGQWVREPGKCSVHLYKTQRQQVMVDSKDPVWLMQNVVIFWRAHPPNSTTP